MVFGLSVCRDTGDRRRVLVVSRRASSDTPTGGTDRQERQGAPIPVRVAGGGAGRAELQWALSRGVVGMRDELHRVGGHRSGDREGLVSIRAGVFVLGSGRAGRRRS